MRERDRLGSLKVRVSGHDGVDLIRSPREQGLSEPAQGQVQLIEQIEGEQPKIERDLIVAAARGVQLPRKGADAVPKDGLDHAVHVLVSRGPRECAVPQIARDGLETTNDRARLVVRKDPLRTEHARVGDASADIVRGDPFVELERAGETEDLGIETLRESTAPQRQAHRFLALALAVLSVETVFGIASVASLSGPQSAWVRD